jgi:two-component system, cell cycle sensor histidine kinase and response regulator CckA
VNDARLGVWTYELRDRSHHWSDSMFRVHGICPTSPLARDEDRFALVHPEDRERVIETVIGTVAQRGSGSFTYRIQQPNGEIRLLESTVSTVVDAEGEPIRLCGAVLDVTDQLRIHEMLAHAQRQSTIGSVASGIAHDFGNLLVSVSLSAARLRRELASSHERATGWLEEIDVALRHARDLIRQLHGYAQRRVAEPAPIQVVDVIRDIEPLLRRLAGERVQLMLRVDDDLPVVRVDPAELSQVLVNLTVNARDAAPGGGRVSIFVHADEGEVIFEVADDGIGMDEVVRARIFEPFFTTKPPGEGTGLGLPTSRAIVERVGGRMSVDSRPGVGTVFRIALPAAD